MRAAISPKDVGKTAARSSPDLLAAIFLATYSAVHPFGSPSLSVISSSAFSRASSARDRFWWPLTARNRRASIIQGTLGAS